jgi:hypothetical protein
MGGNKFLTPQELTDANTKIREITKAKSNRLRFDVRSSRVGNLVLEFETDADKKQAKYALKGHATYSRKIRDSDDRQVSIWIKHADKTDDDTSDLSSDLRTMNETLIGQDQEFSLKWVGAQSKLSLRIAASKAPAILRAGYLYTAMKRHPVVLMRPFPSRCTNCFRLGCHASRCTAQKTCPHCTSTAHDAAGCPVAQDQSKHQCATCAAHVFKVPPTHPHPHNVYARGCPAWEEESGRLLIEQMELLKKVDVLWK